MDGAFPGGEGRSQDSSSGWGSCGERGPASHRETLSGSKHTCLIVKAQWALLGLLQELLLESSIMLEEELC